MPDIIPVQFVLQGGGAKLGTLVAVAEAIHRKSSNLGFRISQVAGTSAGAIVASMLATGRDPALFREKLKSLATTRLRKIATKRTRFGTLWCAFNGYSIYNTEEYRAFLQELFTFPDKTYKKLADLDGGCELFIHACDIRQRDSIVYSRQSDKLLVDALFDSSALPYIFRTFKDKGAPLDGGLLNNFPSVSLEKSDLSGDVLGFLFRKRANYLGV
jgi:NTE family protein